MPARYKRVTRTRTRRYSPSPPRYERVSRTRYTEERRPSHYSLPPPEPARSLPPPTVIVPPPPSVHSAPPPPETVRSRSRVTSRAPSVRAPTERAPSHVSVTREHYVEVESDDTSPSSSSSEDVRSKAPSRAPSKAVSHATSHHTRKTSRSVKPPPAPETVYSEHEREREIRRERRPSRPEFETYRYIDAPRDYGRSRAGSGYHEPRESRDSVRRETRVVVDDGYGRQDVRYRR